MKLLKDDIRRLSYVSRNGASETSENPSPSLAMLARRGFVQAGAWRREKSPTGSKIWTVRDYVITPAGRSALARDTEQSR